MAGGAKNKKGTAPFKGQQNMRQPYQKRAPFGSFSQAGDSVNPARPMHESATSVTQKTSPVLPGITPRVPQRPVRSNFKDNDAFRTFRKDITPWHLYPKADSSNITERTVKSSGTLSNNASVDLLAVYVTDDGTSTGTPLQQLYRIKYFGHAEVNTSTAGITYSIIVDGVVALSWDDFQLATTSPMRDMHEFLNPITVKESIVFRITNATGSAYNFGTAGNDVDAAFYGWTEQYAVGVESDHEGIEGAGI